MDSQLNPGRRIMSAHLRPQEMEMLSKRRWAANENPSGTAAGSHDVSGGLGAWGSQYGKDWMNNGKGAWQPPPFNQCHESTKLTKRY